MATRELSREELVEWAVTLRASGWSMRAIAAELEVSRSYASALYSDPDRAKEKARKDGYRRPCPGWQRDCGVLMDGSWGRSERASRLCADCTAAKQHDTRYWTRDRIIEWLQAAHKILGRNPTITDLVLPTSPSLHSRLSPERFDEAMAAHRALEAAGLRMLHPSVVGREFEGKSVHPGERAWDFALHAAGLGGGRVGGSPDHRKRLYVVPTPEPRSVSVTVELGDGVCPSCGDFVAALVEHTGWCRTCTREAVA